MELESIPIVQIMSKDVKTEFNHKNIHDICKIMHNEKIGSIIIIMEKSNTQKDNLIDEKNSILYCARGIITERDVVRIISSETGLMYKPLSELMSSPLITINSNGSVKDALETMYNRNIRRLPVVDNFGDIIGIVTLTDIFRLIMKQMNMFPNIITDTEQILINDKNIIEKVNEMWTHEYLPF